MGYWILAAIAAAGFLASLGCHVLGWCHITPPWEKNLFWLHIGIFPLWIPLCILGKRLTVKGSGNNLDPVMRELPAWVPKLMKVLFIYALLNFAYFIFTASHYPKHELPSYLELRGISGHWMMFYGVAAAGFAGLARLRRRREESPTVLLGGSATLARGTNDRPRFTIS